MRMTLGLTVFLAAAALAGQEKNAPLAKVRLAGAMSNFVDINVNGKTTASASFATPGGLKVDVRSTSFLSPVHSAATMALLDLRRDDVNDLVKQLKDKKLDAAGFKKAMDRLLAESKERGKGMTIVEGDLTVVEKKLRLTGTARVLDSKKLDKDLPVGGAMVEGEAQDGTFAVGKEKAALAIKNGASPIYVTGQAVGQAKRKGKLRVWGVLRQGDKGALVLEATKVEEVK